MLSHTIKLNDDPPNRLQAERPLVLFSDENSLLLCSAKIVGQHEVDRQCEDGKYNGPDAISPSPVDVCKELSSRFRSAECRDDSWRGGEGKRQTSVSQVRHVGCKHIPAVCKATKPNRVEDLFFVSYRASTAEMF